MTLSLKEFVLQSGLEIRVGDERCSPWSETDNISFDRLPIRMIN